MGTACAGSLLTHRAWPWLSWPPGPGPRGLGPVLPITLAQAFSLKAFWEGVLTTQACSPSWNPIGQSPGAQRRLGSPSPTGLAQFCSQACLGLAGAPVGPAAAHV